MGLHTCVHMLTRVVSDGTVPLCFARPPSLRIVPSPDRSEAGAVNVRGTVGPPLPFTSIKAVDPESHAPLADGVQGLLLARGPGVMSGYWGEEEATRKAFVDGWFDTGEGGGEWGGDEIGN